MKPRRPLPLLLAFAALLLPSGPLPAAPRAPAPDPLAARLAGYDAAFLLVDLSDGSEVRFGGERLKRRFSPCSTFKIPNALISLETGALADADTVFRWDGTKRVIDGWNADQTLRSAMRVSALWVFQELARRVGEPRMTEWVRRLGYGNMDTSAGVDRFWLMSSLAISPEEQVAFVTRLHQGTLPFSPRTMRIVKEVITISDDGTTVLRGKTGTGSFEGTGPGWFVGWVTRGERAWAFATLLQGKTGATGPEAREITRAILKDRGLLP